MDIEKLWEQQNKERLEYNKMVATYQTLDVDLKKLLSHANKSEYSLLREANQKFKRDLDSIGHHLLPDKFQHYE